MAKTSKEELIEFIRKNELSDDVIQKMMNVIDGKEEKHATLDNLKEQSQATLDELMKIAVEGSKKVKSGVSQLADQAEQVGASVKEKIANSEALDQIGNRIKSIVTPKNEKQATANEPAAKGSQKMKFIIGIGGMIDATNCAQDSALDHIRSYYEEETGFDGSIEDLIEQYGNQVFDIAQTGTTLKAFREVESISVGKIPMETDTLDFLKNYDYLRDREDIFAYDVFMEDIGKIADENQQANPMITYGLVVKSTYGTTVWYELRLDEGTDFDPSLLCINHYYNVTYKKKTLVLLGEYDQNPFPDDEIEYNSTYCDKDPRFSNHYRL